MLKKKLLAFIFVLSLVLVFSSSITFAADDLSINRWIVDALLLKNGDLQVSEDLTFNFDDSFNGVYRNIVLDKIDSVEDLSIYELIGGKEIIYKQVDSAKEGDNNSFTTKTNKKDLKIKIFSPSKNEKKVFRLKYLLKNIAIKHSDTAELYYKFLGQENKTYIDYFSINLYLPRFERDRINIFAHGPNNGKIYFSDEKIKSEIHDVSSGQFIENRILFPTEYIKLSENIGNKNFNEIIKEEEAFAQKIEKDRVNAIRRNNLLSKTSIYFSSIIALMVLFIIYKLRRNPNIFKSMTSLDPDDITPAELSLFINKMVSPRSLLANLFALAFKEYLDIENIKSEDKDLKEEYTFTKLKKNTENLISSETFLLDWMFNDVGDGNYFTTEDLERYRTESYKKFYQSQNKWNKLIKEDLKARKYYDDRAKFFGIFIIIMSITSFILAIITLALENLYGLIPLFLGIFILIYGISLLYKTNDKGYIQYRLWKDFKDEFKADRKKNIDISDDKALIYAIALDLPMKDLNEYRSSVSNSYYPIGWGYLYFLTNKNGGSKFEDTFNNKFYGYSGNSTSSDSGSFGGGGGFTGGGGGGAGGGGAGGF